MFTTTARRFVGELKIDGVPYLTYHIAEENQNKYIVSVIYDIQKENKYRNFIIFVDSFKRINLGELATGKNQVLVLKDTEESEEKLKYLNKVNWSNVIEEYYNNNVYFADYQFCDYTDYNGKYVSVFSFVDVEKISRIKHFLNENKSKNEDIICSKELEQIIRKELPTANYIVIDLEQYIEKEKRYYD